MQSPALRFDGELVLVPDSVTDWVKWAFAVFHQRWPELIKVAVTEIADHFFPAMKLLICREQHNLGVQAISKRVFARFVECFLTAFRIPLHLGHQLGTALLFRRGYMKQLAL